MLLRKPPKSAATQKISEGRRREVINDEDLERVAELQAAAWSAHLIASEAAAAIERKLGYGAKIVSAKYRWDADLKMVRSQKKEGAG